MAGRGPSSRLEEAKILNRIFAAGDAVAEAKEALQGQFGNWRG